MYPLEMHHKYEKYAPPSSDGAVALEPPHKRPRQIHYTWKYAIFTKAKDGCFSSVDNINPMDSTSRYSPMGDRPSKDVPGEHRNIEILLQVRSCLKRVHSSDDEDDKQKENFPTRLCLLLSQTVVLITTILIAFSSYRNVHRKRHQLTLLER